MNVSNALDESLWVVTTLSISRNEWIHAWLGASGLGCDDCSSMRYVDLATHGYAVEHRYYNEFLWDVSLS